MKVIRNGHVQEIPRKDVVVGDIVVLETGEEVPADGELLEAISLQVNESNLTGEPVVTKTTVEADFDEEVRMLPTAFCAVQRWWTDMAPCVWRLWAMLRKSVKWHVKVPNRIRNLLR